MKAAEFNINFDVRTDSYGQDLTSPLLRNNLENYQLSRYKMKQMDKLF